MCVREAILIRRLFKGEKNCFRAERDHTPHPSHAPGHYCDQRDNRQEFAKLCRGMHVLDTFCYSGGFGISAALQGASAVDCVDSSAPALALAAKNGALNGVTDKLELIKSDVGDFLDESVRQGKLWDRIVLDPPKLAPRREDLERQLFIKSPPYS